LRLCPCSPIISPPALYLAHNFPLLSSAFIRAQWAFGLPFFPGGSQRLFLVSLDQEKIPLAFPAPLSSFFGLVFFALALRVFVLQSVPFYGSPVDHQSSVNFFPSWARLFSPLERISANGNAFFFLFQREARGRQAHPFFFCLHKGSFSFFPFPWRAAVFGSVHRDTFFLAIGRPFPVPESGGDQRVFLPPSFSFGFWGLAFFFFGTLGQTDVFGQARPVPFFFLDRRRATAFSFFCPLLNPTFPGVGVLSRDLPGC